MLIACWSPKGGSGTTVVAAALALVLAGGDGPSVRPARPPRRQWQEGAGGPTLLVDLAGDIPAALGVPEPSGPGLSDWLAAGPDVPDDALTRLEVEAAPNLRLLALGGSRAVAGCHRGDACAAGCHRGDALVGALAADRRPVVADCGRAERGPELAVAAGAALSLMVLRPCYLALRRALAAPIRPSGLVLIGTEGRSLGRRDVEEVLGVPVRAEVVLDDAVARAVDAGLLATRVPRALERALRSAA